MLQHDYTLKTCSKCNQVKELSLFSTDRAAKDGKRHICSDCVRTHMRERYYKNSARLRELRQKYYYENLEASREKSRNAARKKRLETYGITESEYSALLISQDNRCAICNTTPDVFSVDHDHDTGVVRGLLCKNCNAGIGLLGDSPRNLEQAVIYLKRFK